MAGIGHVADVLGALEIIPVKLPGVGQKKLVAGGIEEELGHREPFPIFEGILNAPELGKLRLAHPVHDVHFHVVVHSLRVITVGGAMMLEGKLDVEHVDHDRDDAHHALVNGRSAPSGPAPLGGAGDHKAVYLEFASCFAGEKICSRIHGSHRRLGHGQSQRPFFIAGF